MELGPVCSELDLMDWAEYGNGSSQIKSPAAYAGFDPASMESSGVARRQREAMIETATLLK